MARWLGSTDLRRVADRVAAGQRLRKLRLVLAICGGGGYDAVDLAGFDCQKPLELASAGRGVQSRPTDGCLPDLRFDRSEALSRDQGALHSVVQDLLELPVEFGRRRQPSNQLCFACLCCFGARILGHIATV